MQSLAGFESFDMDGELAVVETATGRQHLFGCTAAFVLRNCNGARSIDQLSRMTSEEFGESIGRDAVAHALHRLLEVGLIRDAAPGDTEPAVRYERDFTPASGRSVRGLPIPRRPVTS